MAQALSQYFSETFAIGAKVLFGTGVPSSSDGNENDCFLDTSTGNLYNKVGGVWAFKYAISSGGGAAGRGISTISLSGSNLIITYTDATTQTVGPVIGPTGATGATGATGRGVTSASIDGNGRGITTMTINASNHLIVTYSDATTVDLGNVKGDTGNPY